ncbi:MAG: hypothetical protein WAW88_17960 [Nocardioides sp.]
MSFVLEPRGQGVDLVVTGDWSPAAREALESGRADGLVLNYAKGFREQPIDFINGLPIRKLDLLARSVSDLSPVYSLGSTLQELRVQSDPRAVIELEGLPRVRTLAASWPQVRASILFAPQIEDLALPSYSEPNLEPLSALTSLTSLVMKERPKLRSLDGLEAFPWLLRLGVFLASGLTDIGALERSQPPALQVLQLQSCKKITDIAPVAGCVSLNFLDLSEGGEILSVAPVSDLVNLERLYLYESTRVADGDLGPIARLPKLKDFRMQNRRGYSPSVKEIQEIIARRA